MKTFIFAAVFLAVIVIEETRIRELERLPKADVIYCAHPDSTEFNCPHGNHKHKISFHQITKQ